MSANGRYTVKCSKCNGNMHSRKLDDEKPVCVPCMLEALSPESSGPADSSQSPRPQHRAGNF